MSHCSDRVDLRYTVLDMLEEEAFVHPLHCLFAETAVSFSVQLCQVVILAMNKKKKMNENVDRNSTLHCFTNYLRMSFPVMAEPASVSTF